MPNYRPANYFNTRLLDANTDKPLVSRAGYCSIFADKLQSRLLSALTLRAPPLLFAMMRFDYYDNRGIYKSLVPALLCLHEQK